jgi:hypothetical protein
METQTAATLNHGQQENFEEIKLVLGLPPQLKGAEAETTDPSCSWES